MKFHFCLIIGISLAAGCGHDRKHNGHGDGHDHGGDHGHAHDPKHGGQLEVIGKEACHLEFVRDEDNASRMKIYVLQFHPKFKYLKLATSSIRVVATVDGAEKVLDFKALVNPSLQNNSTHSSEYEVGADWLADWKVFDARVEDLPVGGKEYDKAFKFGKTD